ncbi:MAG: class I SAM-dependent methyltransferase [Bacteroidota bacterium]
MKKTKPRIPEGGAIEDGPQITMEQYSEIMKEQLGREYLRFADNVIKKVNPALNSRVLEIGPGPGWAGIYLLEKRNDLKLVGLDPSPDMIRVASRNALKEGLHEIAYTHGSAENMSKFNDGTFNLVISRDSLHHWEDPEKVFKEIKRVLKPDGNLYIHDSRRDMNFPGRMLVTILSRFIPKNMGYYWRTSVAASYTPEEVRGMLDNNGLNDWSVESEMMDLIILRN